MNNKSKFYVNMFEDLPICCKECRLLDDEYSEWHNRSFYYCILNIMLPFKKQSCKKQKLRAEE